MIRPSHARIPSLQHAISSGAGGVHSPEVSLVSARISDVIDATPRSRLIVVDLAGRPFDFLAGQAITAGLHGHHERWPYSIACSPERSREKDCLEILVGLETGRHVDGHPSLATRDMVLDIEGPLGTFTFPAAPDQDRILFVAGGVGISPLRGMLDHVLRRPEPFRVSVLYSARRADEFAFISELRAHVDAGRIELHQTVTRDDGAWNGGRGRIGRTHFEAVLHEPAATLCFVCGPPQFVSESAGALSALGVPAAAIRSEQWGK